MLWLTLLLACDEYNSRRDFCIPIFAILCDGSTFQFFQYTNGGLKHVPDFEEAPSFAMLPLVIPDMSSESVVQYLDTVRKIVETIFSIMLKGYQYAIEAYEVMALKRDIKNGDSTQSMQHPCDGGRRVWQAWSTAVEAGKLHALGDRDGAEQMAVKAHLTFQAM